jgi:hypothetical protein
MRKKQINAVNTTKKEVKEEEKQNGVEIIVTDE